MLIAVTALKIVTNTADAVVYYASGSGVQNRIFYLGAGFTGHISLVTPTDRVIAVRTSSYVFKNLLCTSTSLRGTV